MRLTAKPKKKQLDIIFSKIIRSKGLCIGQGKDKVKCNGNLQCAHLISRRYHGVRWNLQNAVPLCAAHHIYYTNHPLEWDEWCKDYLGEGGWKALKKEARSYKKQDYKEIMAELADYRI